MLRLGLFNELNKGQDIVLLAGTNEDIRMLSDHIGHALSKPVGLLALHDFASVALNHHLELFAVLKPQPKIYEDAPRFFWICSEETFPEVEDKLSVLVGCKAGHHYFDLEGSATTLMVSVNEYDDEWWQKHG